METMFVLVGTVDGVENTESGKIGKNIKRKEGERGIGKKSG